MSTDASLLCTAEVARRLGVRRETVYAYVSRGLLARHPASGHHHSLFDPSAVERLAARARDAGRSGALDVVVQTRLTLLDPDGRLFFRGLDAVELARFRSFEQVVGLLWDGDPGAPWALGSGEAALVRALVRALPDTASPVDRMLIAILAVAAGDPRRPGRRPEDVRGAGARIIAAALAGLDPGEATSGEGGDTAVRLWSALRPDGRTPRPGQRAAVNAALILLADHELAASTLAARVAASAWADPYRVVTAALATLGGTLHGGASDAAGTVLSQVVAPSDAFAVLERQLAAGGVPGFGHRVYRDRDPRADHLLARIHDVAEEPARAAAVTAVLEAAAALQLPPPNVDLALAALADVMGLRENAGTCIFTVARIAGVLAHAIEEYAHRLRFRPRARYVGPVPRR